DGVTLELGAGQAFGLLGPNGAGKTSVVKMIAGLLRPDGGAITVFGSSPGDPAARAQLGFAPEDPDFPKFLRAAEVLDYFSSLLGLDDAERKRRIPETLALAGLESERRQIRQYSKGMKQRPGIAQAILGRPKPLILAEATADLAPLGRRGRPFDLRFRLSFSLLVRVVGRPGIVEQPRSGHLRPAPAASVPFLFIWGAFDLRPADRLWDRDDRHLSRPRFGRRGEPALEADHPLRVCARKDRRRNRLARPDRRGPRSRGAARDAAVSGRARELADRAGDRNHSQHSGGDADRARAEHVDEQ